MDENLKLSVALAVYDGEKYIGEQLASLGSQRRLPDEVIVWDNASKDGTVDIVCDFAERVSFPVEVYRGEENLGYTKGSEKAVERCTGDIIFPCDDDVWLPWKLAGYESVFLAHPEVGAVFSNSIIVDSEARPTGKSLWETANFNVGRRKKFDLRPFEVLLQGNVVYGNTFAFRRTLLDSMLPFSELWDADEWIALISAAVGRVCFFDLPSILYRQHAHNYVGAKEKASLKGGFSAAKDTDRHTFYMRQVEQHESLRDRIVVVNRAVAGTLDATFLEFLEEKIEHLKFRANLDGGVFERLRAVYSEAAKLRYHRCSGGLRSAARDIVVPR